MVASRNMYPLVTYALSLVLMLSGFVALLTFGFTLHGLLLAAALYGMDDGIKTIARGTLPLAPTAFAWTTQTYGGWWSFAVTALCLYFAIATFLLIPDPRKYTDARLETRRKMMDNLG